MASSPTPYSRSAAFWVWALIWRALHNDQPYDSMRLYRNVGAGMRRDLRQASFADGLANQRAGRGARLRHAPPRVGIESGDENIGVDPWLNGHRRKSHAGEKHPRRRGARPAVRGSAGPAPCAPRYCARAAHRRKCRAASPRRPEVVRSRGKRRCASDRPSFRLAIILATPANFPSGVQDRLRLSFYINRLCVPALRGRRALGAGAPGAGPPALSSPVSALGVTIASVIGSPPSSLFFG